MQSFLPEVVDPSRPDGYWTEAFPFDTANACAPDVIGYGLGTSDASSKIELYLNPYNNAHRDIDRLHSGPGWDRREIAELRFPVAFSYADISGNGLNDAIVSDEYGPSMNDIWSNGGRVSWFENCGDLTSPAPWARRYIGRSPGMHRLKVGHFTTTAALQIVAVPIVIQSEDLTSPAPVIIYTAPDEPCSAPVDDDDGQGWPSEIAFADTFRLVHEVVVVPSRNPGGLDKILLAGREGVNIIWYNTNTCGWEYENLGQGLPESPGNPYWGAGSVAVAKVGSDSAGYIASAEAFHGNHVSVYIKDTFAPVNTIVGVKWTRYVLEDFGPLNSAYTGSIHQVVCADVDGDGVDEILVALMGSDPPSWDKTGVWCYKPIDLQNGKFARFKLSDSSAGRIAVGDLTARNVVDLATISYSVPGYFESPNPSVNLYANSSITAEKLKDEVLFRVPQPATTHLIDEVEFLDVSSRKLTLVVVPKNTIYPVCSGDGIKVILGLSWSGLDGTIETHTPAADPFTAVSTQVYSTDGCIRADVEGAVFLLMKASSTSGQPPYSDMSQLVAHNIFPDRFPADVRNMAFPWVKVEDRPWANGRFKGLEFYNLVGFHVRSADDADQVLCHIQLWTAGVNVSAGFHNHTGEIFCEIHACIVNGTGQGGMNWATVPDDQFDPANPDPRNYDSVVVGDMHEHGPLWRTSRDGIPDRRVNGTVDYPWHAWIAGPGSEADQKFDVWLAFEFPPLLARTFGLNAQDISPGVYYVQNAKRGFDATVQNGDPTDGTPIIGTKTTAIDDPARQWQVAVVPGSSFMTLKNVASGSFATTSWPPVKNQALSGTRSLAVLGITSQWAATPTGAKDTYHIWLIGTDLVWSLEQDMQIVLKSFASGEESQWWKFVGWWGRSV